MQSPSSVAGPQRISIDIASEANPMMTILRYLLIAATLAALAGTTNALVNSVLHHSYASDEWVGYCVWIALALNLFYLFANRHPAGKPSWRLFRLFSLWLDAKESELKARNTEVRK
jgi:hypothetical protein